MHLIDIGDVDINYEFYEPTKDRGAHKALVVFINGLADDLTTWAPQLPALRNAGYKVLAFDNRGVGKSSRPSGEYTAELLASDCKALVDKLQVSKPFHLLGVSMGGMIAQSYALEHPDDILSLTLACTYAKPNLFCLRRFDYWAQIANKIDVATVMQDVIAWAFTPAFFEPANREILGQFDDAMDALDIGTEEYLSQLNVIQVFDTTADLHNLSRLKVLVIAGEEDILIPTALSKELHQMIPGSQWKTVKGGHCCLWEFADEFNQAIVQFFDESNS